MELLDIEYDEKYKKELERYEKREQIHNEVMKRNKKKKQWNDYKIRMFGRKQIG